MKDLTPSDLKTILHSKRANIYYLQYCRVVVNGGRVEYITEQGKEQLYWNIPIANTSCVLLGSGTSVTQQAMREFANYEEFSTLIKLTKTLGDRGFTLTN